MGQGPYSCTVGIIGLLADVPLTVEIRKGAEVTHSWPEYLVTAGTAKNLEYTLP